MTTAATTLFDYAEPRGMTLRPYQREAADAIEKQLKAHRSTLAVMPTGTGKTIVFSEVIDRLPAGMRCMVLAHRDELIRQAANKVRQHTGILPEIEKADQWADEHGTYRCPVVVSSIQTQISGMQGQGRMTRFRPSHFGLVIVDEAHHATAGSYRRVLDWYRRNPDCRVLGVTATPDRTDEEALGQVFESVAFDYEINDAVRDAWLVPIQQRTIHIEDLDFSRCRTTAGDLNQGDLDRILKEESICHRIANPTLDVAGDRRTLVFCVSVAQAEMLSDVFNRYKPHCSRWVCGKTPEDERRQMIRDYAAGRFQVLVNVGVATEGFDEPGIQVVAIARPTKSRALYCQAVGRGTRPLPGLVDNYDTPELRAQAIRESAKPFLEVLDFSGNAGKHKLMTTVDILGGNYSDEVVEQARRKVEKSGKPVDVATVLDNAKALVEARKQKERERRQHVKASVKWRAETINPFDVLDIRAPRENAKSVVMATEKQLGLLRKFKVPVNGLSKRAASKLIGSLIQRRQDGKCTYRQAEVLQRFDVDTDGLSFLKAHELIDAIAANGWRKPE